MIKKVDELLIEQLTLLANKLWPDESIEDLRKDFEQSILSDEEQAFLYQDQEHGYIGFIQLSLRQDYVEGCESSPVAYVEGIYIEEAFRKQGIARQLITFAEEWGINQGCVELASDCELDNELSILFHKGSGFEETNRLVCFKKHIKKYPV